MTNTPNYDTSRNRQASGDITWTEGAHTVKGGVQANWLGTSFLSSQRSSGVFNFNGQYTGNPFADYLLGYASAASLSKWAELEFRTRYTHFFVQDDWRCHAAPHHQRRPALRAEPAAARAERPHRQLRHGHRSGEPAAGGGRRRRRRLRVARAAGRQLQQWAPRVGFAYSLPGEKTVLRGGWGLFYSNMITVGGMSSMEINPPNHLRIS